MAFSSGAEYCGYILGGDSVRAVVVMTNNRYCNLLADRIDSGGEDGMIYVYSGEKIVGVFDKGIVECCYITEKKGGQKDG